VECRRGPTMPSSEPASQCGPNLPTHDATIMPESPNKVRSLVQTPAAPALRQIDMLGVHHAEMSGKCIIPAERLLLGAQRTVHLLLAGVVDSVLVPGEIVRAREDGVARFAGRRVNPLALWLVSIGAQ
jgi:hypothetical protein